MKIIKKVFIIFLISFLLNIYIVNATEESQYTKVVLNEQGFENPQNEELKIYSESAILMEQKTGKILYEKDCHARKYPASTTKILTAIIALENCDMNETATASEYAVTSVKSGYTKADIQVGETFTIEQLIDVMMLQSANEAATIIAEHIAGSEANFANMMNQKAKEIGCLDSNFVNANGMHNENHYSTAYDLALIARYCMQNEKFREIVKLPETSLPWTEHWGQEQVNEHGERIFKNTNKMMQPDSKYYYPYCTGIKSGFTTPAKNCLISSSNKNGFETVSVILHAESTEDGASARYVDTINLFEYGYNNYNIDDILKEYNMYDTSVATQVQENVSNNSAVLGKFKNYEDSEDNGNNILSNINLNIIQIIIGAVLLFGILILGIIKKILKIKKVSKLKKSLYYFKIN